MIWHWTWHFLKHFCSDKCSFIFWKWTLNSNNLFELCSSDLILIDFEDRLSTWSFIWTLFIIFLFLELHILKIEFEGMNTHGVKLFFLSLLLLKFFTWWCYLFKMTQNTLFVNLKLNFKLLHMSHNNMLPLA